MDDTIYRQAAIDALIRKMEPHNNGDGTMTICIMSKELVRETLNDLPSAQPETKQGEWIPHSEMYTFPGTELTSSGGVMCSSCGFRTHNRMHKLIGCPYNYCPICGTSMRKENKENE